MKRFSLFVALFILAGTVVLAQTAAVPPKPAAPGTGIGVIILGTALLESDPGKAAVEKINKAMEPVKISFEKAAKEAEEIQKKLQAAKTDAEKNALSRELDSKARAVKLLQEDAQAQSEALQEQHFPSVRMLFDRIVDEYAKENNLAIVIDPSVDPSNIIFAAKANDITAEVMRRMNAAFAKDPKLTAPAAAAPAPAAPAKTP